MGDAIKKSDTEIQQAVVRELGWDTRISPTEVGVQVKNGVVTLTGMVDSWAKRAAAEQAAHRVFGVHDVANDLEVQLTGSWATRTDTDIAQSVRYVLEWDVTVPDKDIRSTVSKGVVTLEGTVNFWTERSDAERAVEKISGVKAVVNRIEVRPSVRAEATQVRSAIQDALERHADREAARIDVRVHEGAVDVTGVVHTWSEKQAVLGAVRGTRGVREVVDRVTVQPYA
jgi:osmotically-inducible protein OsmY